MGSISNPVADPPRDVPPERIWAWPDMSGQLGLPPSGGWDLSHYAEDSAVEYVRADLATAPAGVTQGVAPTVVVLDTPIYGAVPFYDFLDIDDADCIQLGTPYTPPNERDTGYRTTGGWNEERRLAAEEIVKRALAALTPQDAAVAALIEAATKSRAASDKIMRYLLVRGERDDLISFGTLQEADFSVLAALAAIRTGGK